MMTTRVDPRSSCCGLCPHLPRRHRPTHPVHFPKEVTCYWLRQLSSGSGARNFPAQIAMTEGEVDVGPKTWLVHIDEEIRQRQIQDIVSGRQIPEMIQQIVCMATTECVLNTSIVAGKMYHIDHKPVPTLLDAIWRAKCPSTTHARTSSKGVSTCSYVHTFIVPRQRHGLIHLSPCWISVSKQIRHDRTLDGEGGDGECDNESRGCDGDDGWEANALACDVPSISSDSTCKASARSESFSHISWAHRRGPYEPGSSCVRALHNLIFFHTRPARHFGRHVISVRRVEHDRPTPFDEHIFPASASTICNND